MDGLALDAAGLAGNAGGGAAGPHTPTPRTPRVAMRSSRPRTEPRRVGHPGRSAGWGPTAGALTVTPP